MSLRSCFNALERSPTIVQGQSTASVICLAPVHFRRSVTRLVSYYALFKWLLLSQHPGVWATPHPFPLNIYFGTLAGGLGCFPFEHGPYHPCSDSQVKLIGIRSLSEFGNPRGPSSKQCSTSNNHHLRLALKLFRRTSYLQVRLEFLRYPQFIRSLFNVSRFGPPFSVT